MILGLHVIDSLNAGDVASGPLQYFGWPMPVSVRDIRVERSAAPAMVVFGGGSITASPNFRRWPCLTVGWGVGHHVRQAPWHDAMMEEHTRAEALCDLYFPRDRVPGFEEQWTPCPSCMHPVFDEPIEIEHAVVRYSAARRIDVSNGADPHMTNEDGTIEHAVRFLGSGEKVITSSYHGAYWARLLGRKVEMVRWGSKFDYVPDATLDECRDRNRLAYQRVLEAYGSVHRGA